MPPKINYPIPTQGYEFARDRIAAILDIELSNQAYVCLDEDLNVAVAIEQNNPYKDEIDLSIIQVCLANGNYDQKHLGSVVGTYQYFLDITVKSKAILTATGDYLSSLKLQRIIGAVRAILEDPAYKTLGFVPGFITRTFVSNFDIADQIKNDSLSIASCRLVFNVQLTETSKPITPTLIDGYDTIATIGGTNRGYQYSGNNY